MRRDRWRGWERHDSAGRYQRADMFARGGGNLSGGIGLVGCNSRCEFHALLDAGAELWPCLDDEVAEGFPHLLGLNDAERLAPVVKAAGRGGHLGWLRQHACGMLEKIAAKRRNLGIGLGEGVGCDD